MEQALQNRKSFDIAVLFLVFNRPDNTTMVFEAIRKAKPTRLYVAADGSRSGRENEVKLVAEVRRIATQVDWNCEVKTLFRERNLGCMIAVSTAISWFFQNEEMGIILEDDCVPSLEFFDFCAWGLSEYKAVKNIGLISGSNLIDYKKLNPEKYRNGFSNYINIWGWATWRDRWEGYNPNLTLYDISAMTKIIKNQKIYYFWERLFWSTIFKNVLVNRSTWDFQLQYLFFAKNYYSVYPSKNLIYNVGFDITATHTLTKIPDYVIKSKPSKDISIMSLPPMPSISSSIERDRLLARTIWYCTPFRTLRIYFLSILRYSK